MLFCLQKKPGTCVSLYLGLGSLLAGGGGGGGACWCAVPDDINLNSCCADIPSAAAGCVGGAAKGLPGGGPADPPGGPSWWWPAPPTDPPPPRPGPTPPPRNPSKFIAISGNNCLTHFVRFVFREEYLHTKLVDVTQDLEQRLPITLNVWFCSVTKIFHLISSQIEFEPFSVVHVFSSPSSLVSAVGHLSTKKRSRSFLNKCVSFLIRNFYSFGNHYTRNWIVVFDILSL